MTEFFDKDFEDSGNTRGKTLEYILLHIGPVIISLDEKQIIRRCFVLDSNKNKVGGDKNFDMAFFCRYSFLRDLVAELIESKLDLNGFLRPFAGNINNRARKKLVYMEEIRKALINSSEIKVALATLQDNTQECQKLLIEEGFNELLVFNYKLLKAALYKKYKTA